MNEKVIDSLVNMKKNQNDLWKIKIYLRKNMRNQKAPTIGDMKRNESKMFYETYYIVKQVKIIKMYLLI